VIGKAEPVLRTCDSSSVRLLEGFEYELLLVLWNPNPVSLTRNATTRFASRSAGPRTIDGGAIDTLTSTLPSR